MITQVASTAPTTHEGRQVGRGRPGQTASSSSVPTMAAPAAPSAGYDVLAVANVMVDVMADAGNAPTSSMAGQPSVLSQEMVQALTRLDDRLVDVLERGDIRLVR